MNRTHRVIWSDSHGAFVVTHENAKTRGKPSSTRKALATAVALGLGSLISPFALAGGSCSSTGPNTITSHANLTCILANGGSLSVTPGGAIDATGPGVLLDADTGNTDLKQVITGTRELVNNDGTIAGTHGILLQGTATHGSIVNRSTGVITSHGSGNGITLKSASLQGKIANAGNIAPAGSVGNGIELDRALLNGAIDNSGTIAAGRALGTAIGANTSTLNGNISNSGTLSAFNDGIRVFGSTLNGNVINTGEVTSALGVRIENSTLSGSLINRGDIAGDVFGVYVNKSQIGGTIDLGGNVFGGTDGAIVARSTIGGNLINSGKLSAQTLGLSLEHSHLLGNLINTGEITASTALDVEHSDLKNLRNTGTLAGFGSGGALLIENSTLSGSVRNLGTISQQGSQAALRIESNTLIRQGLVNSGVISSDSAPGMRVNNATIEGGVTNAGGTINGVTGIAISSASITGGLTNSGTVSGSLKGLSIVSSDLTGDIRNGGLLTGGDSGVVISDSSINGWIINNTKGVITSQNTGTGGQGVSLLNSSATGISNSGTIAGGQDAIFLKGVNLGALNNKGLLTGHRVGELVTHSTISGGIRNAGTIEVVAPTNTTEANANVGDGIAIGQSLVEGGITNTGTISGGSHAGAAMEIGQSTLNGDLYNSGKLIGANQGVRLFNSTLNGNFDNAGNIAGKLAVGVGITTSIVNGSLVNSGKIAGDSKGLLVTQSTFSGDITNRGSIRGGSDAMMLVLDDIGGSVVNEGQISSRSGGAIIYQDKLGGGFTNTGNITANSAAIISASTLGGDVRNSGSITGQTGGLSVYKSTIGGAIQNLGDIAVIGGGTQAALFVNSHSTVAGGVFNSGTLESKAGKGIEVKDSHILAGGIENAGGTLLAKTGIDVSNSSVKGGIRNSGTLTGTAAPLRVSGSKIAEGFNNSGVIELSDPAVPVHSGTHQSNDGIGVELVKSRLSGGFTNVGEILGGTFAGTAVKLDQSTLQGDFRNSGSLIAADNGLRLTGSSITGSLDSSGTIGGYAGVGVSLENSTIGANLINSGKAFGGGAGIFVSQGTVGGSVFNSGSASGDEAGLRLNTATVGKDVINSGTLSSGSYAGLFVSGSTLGGDINNSGLIKGVSGAVIARSELGNIVNSGTITGNSGGLGLIGSKVAGSLLNQGTLSSKGSQFGSTFGALYLRSGAEVAQGISNTGLIDGGTSNGVELNASTLSGGGFYNNGTVTGATGIALQGATLVGGLSNDIHGNVSSNKSTGSGITLNSSLVQGGIANKGIINSGVDSGSGLLVEHSTIAGGINNAGTLKGADFGLFIENSQVDGGLINSGTISGGSVDGVTIRNSQVSGGVTNTGGISGTQYALSISSNSTLSGNISNSGSIRGSTDGLRLGHSVIEGGVYNSGRIVADTNVALASFGASITGGVTNSGSLLGVYGLVMHDGTAQNIFNSGTIVGSSGGIGIYNNTVTGGIRNQGVIISSLDRHAALLLKSGSVVSNGIANSGLINGDSGTGLEILNSTLTDGGIRNTGSINGKAGVSLETSVVNGGIKNSGNITGDASGAVSLLASTLNGELRNSGTLSGAEGIDLHQSTLTGDIANSGFVQGTANGINLVDSHVTGSLRNSAKLLGSADGVQLQKSSIDGSVVNSGLISGSHTGLALADSKLGNGLTNSGTIAGGEYAILADAASLTQLAITGKDTAQFIGTVQAPGAHVSVASGATYTLDDGNRFQVADFTNNGVLGIAATSANKPNGAVATIDGNYLQSTGATLSTHVLNDSTYGHLVVTGTATLPDEAKIYVDVSDTGHAFTTSSLDNVLTAGTLKSNGTFDVTTNSQLFNFNGIKDGNTVDLGLSAKSPNGVSRALKTSNSQVGMSAARVLDSQFASNPNSALTPYFVGATSSSQVASAVSQTLPSNAGAATQVSQNTLSTITDVVQSRIDANTGLASGDGFYGDKNLWMKPFGSWINQGDRNNAAGYDASVYGMAFGIDAQVSELTRLGVSFSYAKADTNSNSSQAPQSAKVDLYELMAYGSHTLAPDTELSFHAGVGQNRNDGERNINLGGTSGKANANYDSQSVTAGLAVGKAFNLTPQTRFVPSVRADYTWIQDDSYHEHGSSTLDPLLLDVDKHQTDQLILGLDGKLSHEILPGTSITGNLGVGYDVLHDDSSITSAYAGAPGQSFTTQGLNSSPWLARGGVGLGTKLGNGVEISVNYDAETRTNFTNQTASVKLNIPF